MLKPICVPCHRFYRPEKTGFTFLEGMPTLGARPGLEDAHKWKPYKLWQGDKWKCEGCGHEIIVGTGRNAWDEHYTESFKATVKDLNVEYQVNDC